MYKAVVTDLDGTLLNKEHEISEFTIKTMQKFIDKGYKLYIATGRIETGAKLISEKINRKVPLITTNGARVLDEESNELFSAYLDDFVRDTLVNIDLTKYGNEIFLNGYSGKNWYVVSEEHLEYYFKRRKDKTYKPYIITTDEFKNKKYNKIYFIGKYEKLLEIREYLREKISEYANIDFVSKNSLEIYDKSANKANAAKLLLERDGIKNEEVISFGDGLNDFKMLSFFDNSYIMNNSLQELKELLPHKEVLADSDTDSVAKKIIEIFDL
ncbi:HAD family hydrolase [Oceanivirga salmonicida]|uniref:HAD family hydrolase n=1 Tax=Oceanivirga salmonicida TaxID=1769291 RepID=UPI0012E2A57B|nr:HAD family hydrolase [Oceanivirga salmonicida]